MTNQRYPADLAISAQDFSDSGWRDAIAQTSCQGYLAMSEALATAACSAIEQGRNEHGKVLWLLANACSMALSPSSPNKPFEPYLSIGDRRSAIPDDLSDADISFLAEIVDTVNDSRLKARLADLVWLKGKPRDAAFALKAIDAYRAIALDTETWLHDGGSCWSRAISLALMLRDGAGDRLAQMEASIIQAFNAATQQDGFLKLWLADLLKSNGLGGMHKTDVANKLETLARKFESGDDLHGAREYFSAATDWYKAVPDEAKAAEMTMFSAESWVKEAIVRVSSNSPSHAVAASFYENAIQIYRTIPKAERAVHRVEERISELRTILNESGEKSLGEMGIIKARGIDITQMVADVRKSVSGKSTQDALLAFANLHQGANVEKLRESALERMRQHPFLSMISASTLSSDGRVIAKRPGVSLSGKLTEDDEIAIRAEMIRDHGMHIGLIVQGGIWPALEVLLLEHRLRKADFVGLAKRSPIVPKDRAALFGKALFVGYDRDFVTALHVLIPQIENMVRVHLKQAGVQTTNIDRNGIQNENGLSTLMELPEVEGIFGEDLAFEIRALFCDPFGPNLRNELAHGLLSEDACHSTFSIYAWWFALRLTFITWWNALHDDQIREESNGDD